MREQVLGKRNVLYGLDLSQSQSQFLRFLVFAFSYGERIPEDQVYIGPILQEQPDLLIIDVRKKVRKNNSLLINRPMLRPTKTAKITKFPIQNPEIQSVCLSAKFYSSTTNLVLQLIQLQLQIQIILINSLSTSCFNILILDSQDSRSRFTRFLI